jgi:dephospho-CoA kinase
MLTVGLTGGIASGKSAVANMFMKLGAGLVDTDVLAREVVAPGEPGLAAVRTLFGPSVMTATGELNRAVMRSLIFADPEKRRHLEDLLHPLIRERTLRRLDLLDGPYAIVVVPLLVETGFVELVDRVLVVDCPPTLQLERLIHRDRIPRAEAIAMIEAQADRVERLQTADDVIDNSGDHESTRRQVHHLHDQYIELARANRS